MNHSLEVITDFGEDYFSDGSSNSLKDIARSKLRCIPKPPSLSINNLNDNDKDNKGHEFIIDLNAMENNDINEHKKEMVAKARRWIGILVHKEINGKGYVGKVQDYDEGTKLYKIEYELIGYDEVLTYQQMLQIVAPPHIVCDYLNRIEAEKNVKKQKRRALRARASNVFINKKNELKGKRPYQKCIAKRAKAGDYVPLAFCEKKRDAYYWY